jgi:hypothetical protein
MAEVLALLHAGKFREADAVLAKQGTFKLRLANDVIEYGKADLVSTLDCPVGRVFDNLLPVALVQRLTSFLDDDGPFFREHNYGPTTPYFSYAHDLANPEGTLMEQTAAMLRESLLPHFPELAKARKIEWWGHSRDHEKVRLWCHLLFLFFFLFVH